MMRTASTARIIAARRILTQAPIHHQNDEFGNHARSACPGGEDGAVTHYQSARREEVAERVQSVNLL